MVLFVGFVFGLAGLLIIWFVYGQHAAWLRVSVVMVVLIALVSIVASVAGGLEGIVEVVLILPAYVLNATSLLWLWRYWSGWGLAVYNTDVPSPPRRPHQFAVRDLFLATGVIAIAIAMARGFPSRNPHAIIDGYFVLGLAIAPVIVAASVIPCIAFVFAGRISPFVLAYAYSMGLAIIEGALSTVLSRHGFELGSAIEMGACQFIAILTMTTGLVVARGRGVVLVRGRGGMSNPPLAPGGDFGHNLPQDWPTSPTSGDDDGGF